MWGGRKVGWVTSITKPLNLCGEIYEMCLRKINKLELQIVESTSLV